jgi:hypothetical protein
MARQGMWKYGVFYETDCKVFVCFMRQQVMSCNIVSQKWAQLTKNRCPSPLDARCYLLLVGVRNKLFHSACTRSRSRGPIAHEVVDATVSRVLRHIRRRLQGCRTLDALVWLKKDSFLFPSPQRRRLRVLGDSQPPSKRLRNPVQATAAWPSNPPLA